MKRKWSARRIALILLAVAAVVWVVCGVKIQSVEDYKAKQESVRKQHVVEQTTEAETVGVPEAGTKSYGNVEEKEIASESEEKSLNQTQAGQPVGEAGAEEVPGSADQPETQAPEGRPDEPQKKQILCTISISCEVLVRDLSVLEKEELKSYVPADGWLLKPVTLKMEEGASVYDALLVAVQAFDIQMDAAHSTLYGTYYVRGIGHLYEKAAGQRSGWMYKVNGRVVQVGASGCTIKEGDVISWHYSVDGGKDVEG